MLLTNRDAFVLQTTLILVLHLHNENDDRYLRVRVTRASVESFYLLCLRSFAVSRSFSIVLGSKRNTNEYLPDVHRYIVRRSSTGTHCPARTISSTIGTIIGGLSTVNRRRVGFDGLVLTSRFCASFLTHKTFTYEQYTIEYSFVNEALSLAEVSLSDIQLYRRPFAWMLFAVCQTGDELRLVLDKFSQLKQREKTVHMHLFVRYRNKNGDDDDGSFSEPRATDEAQDEP